MRRLVGVLSVAAAVLSAMAVAFAVGLNTPDTSVPAAIPPADAAPACTESQPVATCLTEWALGNIDDLPRVLEVLTDRTVADADFFKGGCHETWHAVGEEAGRRYVLASALDAWAYSCYGGFLHGAMSTAVPLIGLDEFTRSAPSICAAYAGRPDVVPLDCWHGVGHGLASVLPFPRSMEACVGVASTDDELAWCTWGAAETLGEQFIEDPATRAKYEPLLDGLCEDLSVGQQACIRIAAPMLKVSGRTIESIYEYCATQQEPLRSWCAFSAGQLVATDWLDGADAAIRCAAIPDLEVSCAAGAGRNIGRTDEWETLESSPRKQASVSLSICPEFTGAPRTACEEAEAAVRALELSPQESGDLTNTWWDGRDQPSAIVKRPSQY